MGSERRGILYSSSFQTASADLGAIAAGDHVGHPVLHHNRKLSALVPLAVGSYWLSGIFETITVMHGNPVEGLQALKFRKLVKETRCEHDL
jgi:hypothetical protein